MKTTKKKILAGINPLIAILLASALAFGTQFVAAQTATSTDPVDAAPSEEDVLSTEPSDTSVESAEVPTDTATADSVEPQADTASSTNETIVTEPIDAESEETVDKLPVVAETEALWDAYFEKNGKYLQILRGNVLPEYESGSVAEKLGENVSEDVWVHIYDAPSGKGYQIFHEADGVLNSIGYGPEAADRTFSRSTVVTPSATSTASSPQ